MKRRFNALARSNLACAAIAAVATIASGLSQVAVAGEVDAALAASARLSPNGVMRAIVQLEGEKPVSAYAPALQSLPRNARAGKLKSLMLADYQAVAQKISPKLAAMNARELQPLWLMHSMLIEVPRNQLNSLAALPGVKKVNADLSLRSAQRSGVNTLPLAKERALAQAAAAAGKPALPAKGAAAGKPYHSVIDALAKGEPLSLPAHYLAMDVPAAWQSGARGKGVTIAIVDSGVDTRSTAIAQGFRAQAGDWFDPYGESPTPTDNEGHGTYVAGLLVGDVVSSSSEPVESVPTGVAPEAKWIAARLFDDGGRGHISAIQRIYQWLLDPDGKPETADAPDIVNNSWGLPQTAGRCDTTMSRAIEALRLADISVVFAAGNDGPNENTSLSPANNPGVISVGALRSNREASRRSSRGPSACGAAAYPTLWTAGENLPALDRLAAAAGAVGQADGSSFAAAAVSGALAVLRSAAPDATSQALEDALIKSVPVSVSTTSTSNFSSPQLSAALAQVTGKPVAAAAPIKLRWQPAVATNEPLALNKDTLTMLLPWEEKIVALSGDGVQAKAAGEWTLKPDAAAPGKPLMLSAKAASGREFSIETFVRIEGAAAASAMAKHAPVNTAMNKPVMIALSASSGAVAKQGLRLSSPTRGGRVKMLDNGQVEYTPPKNFVGTDLFTYSLPLANGKPGVTTLVTVSVQRPS
jgi:serine protease AprX